MSFNRYPYWAEEQKDHRQRLQILFYFGHFVDSFPERDRETWKAVQAEVSPTDQRYLDAVASYQAFCTCENRHPIKVDGDYGPITTGSLGRRFCLHPDRTVNFDCMKHEFSGGQPRWDLSRGGSIALWTDSNLGSLNSALFLEAGQWWSKECGIRVSQASGKTSSDIFAHAHRIDGNSNTLAWSFSPDRNQAIRANGGGRQLEQRYDTGDIRTFSDRQSALEIANHELGHAFHFDGHTNDTNDIMYPSFSGPQGKHGANEIRFMREAYGDPTGGTPPTPGDPVGNFVARVELNGKVYIASSETFVEV